MRAVVLLLSLRIVSGYSRLDALTLCNDRHLDPAHFSAYVMLPAELQSAMANHTLNGSPLGERYSVGLNRLATTFISMVGADLGFPMVLDREIVVTMNTTLYGDWEVSRPDIDCCKQGGSRKRPECTEPTDCSSSRPVYTTLAVKAPHRVLHVAEGAHVVLCDLTILGGAGGSADGRAQRHGVGGAFRVAAGGSLSLVRCNVSGFTGATLGGAVYVDAGGHLTVVDSTLGDNHVAARHLAAPPAIASPAIAPRPPAVSFGRRLEGQGHLDDEPDLEGEEAVAAHGGALYVERGGVARLYNTTLHGNTAAAGAGGAIYSSGGELSLARCSIRRNHARACGAICLRAAANEVCTPESNPCSSVAMPLPRTSHHLPASTTFSQPSPLSQSTSTFAGSRC